MSKSTQIPVIALVGVPNVGKSSLVNRLLGSRATIIHDQSHTTRDITRHIVEWEGRLAYLQDTPGFGNTKDTLTQAAQEQLAASLKTADVILFVIDSTQSHITESEKKLARTIRSLNKPTFLLLNKSDKLPTDTSHFKALGIENTLHVSAHHGEGIEELKALAAKSLPTTTTQTQLVPHLKIAILGRPNVGKSSIINKLGGEEAAIVSEIAGTTRDPVNITITQDGQQLLITDTAGLRKPGKIGRDIEYFSLARTRQVVDSADVCVLVVDATEAATGQDQRIAGIIREAGKGLVLAVNKSDELTGEDRQSMRLERRLQREFEFVWWAPYVLISAQTGKNLDKLIEQICIVGEKTQQKLRTKDINDALQAAMSTQPPAATGNLRPKLNYATQTGSLPLEITIYGTHPDSIHFSYRRYLENKLREKFDLQGVPIKLIFKSKYGHKLEND
ncbi:MAG: GTPase [Patescibacteria group bacterium]|nr:GTPase [Patescibacteria group bacterium]